MNVKELIEELSKYPQDTQVWIAESPIDAEEYPVINVYEEYGIIKIG